MVLDNSKLQATGTDDFVPSHIDNTLHAKPRFTPQAHIGGKALTDTQREQLYRTWRDTHNVRHVARVCGVAVNTAQRYKAQDDWVEREKLDRAHQQGLSSTLTLEDVKAEVILALRDMRRLARAKAEGVGFKTAREAAATVIECARLELELLGHATPRNASVMMLALERLDKIRRRPPASVAEAQVEGDAVQESTAIVAVEVEDVANNRAGENGLETGEKRAE